MKKECSRCKETKVIPKNRSVCSGCRTDLGRLKSGVMRPPDFAEVTTAGYKEPMEKVVGGFGFYGAITRTNDGLHIQCHKCGYYFAALGQHIAAKHKMKPRDYKIEYGLRIKDGLLSPQQKILAQDVYNKTARRTPEEWAEVSRKGKEALKKKGYKPGGSTWSAQGRNERGNCKKQTLAKLKLTAAKNNGVVIQRTFEADYGTGSISTVEHWFGSWAKGLSAAGVTNFFTSKAEERVARRAATEEGMSLFYEKTGRSPQAADFNSCSYLPNYSTIQHLYPTLNVARAAAGVPLIVCLGGPRWGEIELGKEEPWMFESNQAKYSGYINK